MTPFTRRNLRFVCRIGLLTALICGCGTTQQRAGTEQLLLSDSVDRSVDLIDFSVFANRKVYLDARYIQPVKGDVFVNSDYIISSLRQKLITSGCLLQTSLEAADYVLEARVGALGLDALEVTYGIPASNALATAANAVTGVPGVPTIPEISVGKRNAATSTTKIVAFAYHRETGTPVWQSGSAVARADAKDSWLLGAGPLQRGSIYKTPRFAGLRLKMPFKRRPTAADMEARALTVADTHAFVHPAVLEQQLANARSAQQDAGVQPATHEEPKSE
ncbi:MAG: DUF6655 family protein [Planctomycetaceae bacterium]